MYSSSKTITTISTFVNRKKKETFAAVRPCYQLKYVDDVRAQLPPNFAKLVDVQNEGEIPELGDIVSE